MSDPTQRSLGLAFGPAGTSQGGAPGEITLRGVVRNFVYQGEKGFAVVRLLGLDGRESVVVGDLGAYAPGEQIRVTGRSENHPVHGPRLRATTVVPELPSTPEGIQRLLGSGFVDGIGPEMARRIVRLFGSSTLDVIADHPERLREVDGIGPERARRIQETFRARRAESEARAFLQALGLGPALVQRVLKKFGDQAPLVLRENPYRLATDVHGVGFKTADRVAQALGVGTDDPRRARGAVLHLLVEASEEGHCALTPGELAERASALDVPAVMLDDAVTNLLLDRFVVRDRDLLYPPPLFAAERALAKKLAAMEASGVEPLSQTAYAKPEVKSALEPLHPTQRRAVEALETNALLVLTGGPGTGKTTTVRAVVALARAAGMKICLAAPTGRAAKRLTEATREPARTLHRVLEWNPRLARFQRGADSPIDADIVLVDEASMLDLPLAARLVDAVKSGARLVFVGDIDQLPSVGPGTVLADLLATPWIPSVRLTEVFRQAAASAIVRGAHAILRGEIPTPSPPRAPDAPAAPPAGELFLVTVDDAERAAQLVLKTVAERIPRSFGLDAVHDVQVLVPTHKGPLGAAALNALLQRALNPNVARSPLANEKADGGESAVVLRAQPGDKVMQLKNDYDLDVYNGDVGTVLRVERDTVTVQLDGREVLYKNEQRDALALCYAATVHKAQGSEYDAVVLGLHTSHFVLLNRALLYTALTRAKRLAVLVCSERALRMAAQNVRTAARIGALRERLADAYEAASR